MVLCDLGRPEICLPAAKVCPQWCGYPWDMESLLWDVSRTCFTQVLTVSMMRNHRMIQSRVLLLFQRPCFWHILDKRRGDLGQHARIESSHLAFSFYRWEDLRIREIKSLPAHLVSGSTGCRIHVFLIIPGYMRLAFKAFILIISLSTLGS